MEHAQTTGSKVHDVLIEPASMNTYSKMLATLNKTAAEYGLRPAQVLDGYE